MIYGLFLHSPPRICVPVLIKIEYIPNIKIFILLKPSIYQTNYFLWFLILTYFDGKIVNFNISASRKQQKPIKYFRNQVYIKSYFF